MSIYCSFGMFGAGDEYVAPLVYQGSHVLPNPNDLRGGTLDLGYIPGFITRAGRDRTGDVNPPEDDEGAWPYLRVSLCAAGRDDHQEDTVVLDRAQVEHLRDELSEWLLRCDDPAAWLDRRS